MAELYQELKTVHGVMRGVLHKPENVKKCPLVIMFHGFTGNKMENTFLFVQLSRYLCKHNIASLRFDFIGSGESDGKFSEMTFSKEVREGEAVLEYARTLTFANKLIVLGLSMGGAVTTQVAKLHHEDIDKLVLWSAAGNMKNFAKNFSTSSRNERGNIELGGIELGGEFITDLLSYPDLYDGIDIFTKPVGIFHGTNDGAVPVEYGKKYSEVYKNNEIHLLEGADHTYTNSNTRGKLFEMTKEFVEK